MTPWLRVRWAGAATCTNIRDMVSSHSLLLLCFVTDSLCDLIRSLVKRGVSAVYSMDIKSWVRYFRVWHKTAGRVTLWLPLVQCTLKPVSDAENHIVRIIMDEREQQRTLTNVVKFSPQMSSLGEESFSYPLGHVSYTLHFTGRNFLDGEHTWH